MTDDEKYRIIQEAMMPRNNTKPYTYGGLSGNHMITTHTYPAQSNVGSGKAEPVYSLAEVQLTNGAMVAMTITASPTLSKHLMESMKSTGFLSLFNDTESLLLRADEVRALKLIKLTQE